MSWLVMIAASVATAVVFASIALYWHDSDIPLRHLSRGLSSAFLSVIQKCGYSVEQYPGHSGRLLFGVSVTFGYVIYTHFVADLTASMTAEGQIGRPKNFQVTTA